MIGIDDILRVSSAEDFEYAAMEIFRFQSRECPPYAEYLNAIGVDPATIGCWSDIPHLPIEIFRARKVYCGPEEPEIVFTSSTTGGDTPSKHYVATPDNYRKVLRKAFSLFYGDASGWRFYALLPSYLERKGSSLVWMADDLINQGGGGFYLDDLEGLVADMEEYEGRKILLGVSYALWDLAEQYSPKLRDTIVMETGGMKGRREELTKEALHKILCEGFGVEKIHAEYGMAELTSQAYSTGHGIFTAPPWMKVFTRDLNDPFRALATGERGGINITDLGNIFSCAFIETQDLGVIRPGGMFSILGRIDHSQRRGCNLMMD